MEGLLARRLLADPFLASLLEELCLRQIDKEHSILESCSVDKVPERQGVIRGTRYFLEIRSNEKQQMEALDRPDDGA